VAVVSVLVLLLLLAFESSFACGLPLPPCVAALLSSATAAAEADMSTAAIAAASILLFIKNLPKWLN
jgi:hypothetical protein